MNLGSRVEGALFDDGVLIGVGTHRELWPWDPSGAAGEQVMNGLMTMDEACAAVRLPDGSSVGRSMSIFRSSIARRISVSVFFGIILTTASD